MLKNNKKKISICIATYNRCEMLKEIILLLEHQTISRDLYEIIITDSFSNDKTNQYISDLSKIYDNIIFKNDSNNILAAKRNDGIRLSNAEIIIFLDDDVYPTKNFIESHYNANINNCNIFFCGQIRFPTEMVSISNYYRFRDEQHLNQCSIDNELPFNRIVVMNLSFRKDFIRDIGLFNEKFVNYGCEDTEFGYRVIKNGYKLKYLDSALAVHHEKSANIVEYAKKIKLNARYGKKILRSINENVYNSIPHSKFDNINVINSILFNKLFGNCIKKFLLLTDKLKIFYNYILFKYYLYYENYQTILSCREEKEHD